MANEARDGESEAIVTFEGMGMIESRKQHQIGEHHPRWSFARKAKALIHSAEIRFASKAPTHTTVHQVSIIQTLADQTSRLSALIVTAKPKLLAG